MKGAQQLFDRSLFVFAAIISSLSIGANCERPVSEKVSSALEATSGKEGLEPARQQLFQAGSFIKLGVAGDLGEPQTSSNAQPKVAFVIRTFSPSAGNRKLIYEWLSDLKTHEYIDIYVSIDQTGQRHAEEVQVLIAGTHAAGFRVNGIHRYTQDDMTQAYPALKGREYHDKRKYSLPWGYHVQSVDLWLQTLARTYQTYEYIWVVEDDLGYSGNISSLLQRYSRSSSDLISTPARAPNRSFWEDGQSEKYKQRVSKSQRLWMSEHIVRMSRKLLQKLHEWSIAGAIDRSEAMPYNVCRLEKLHCSWFKAHDVGKPFSTKRKDAIHKIEVWEAMVSKDLASGHSRLYHPLKF
eukprot:TRINITY_DN3235_c0_g1_i1.p1 TRINITY_DN3235_c0_g1~~TRINITY_DN3235_c0_g1_i1.p1  ORF type:complete len:352 (+),score=36.64 TRINITY_DN3235_c0_g1_i1:90-1145(+)